MNRRNLLSGLLSLPVLSCLKPVFGLEHSENFVHPKFGRAVSIDIQSGEYYGDVFLCPSPYTRYVSFPIHLLVDIKYDSGWSAQYSCFNPTDDLLLSLAKEPKKFLREAVIAIDGKGLPSMVGQLAHYEYMKGKFMPISYQITTNT